MESRKMAGVEISFLKLKSDINTLVYTYYDYFHLYEIKFHVKTILFANFKKYCKAREPQKNISFGSKKFRLAPGFIFKAY